MLNLNLKTHFLFLSVIPAIFINSAFSESALPEKNIKATQEAARDLKAIKEAHEKYCEQMGGVDITDRGGQVSSGPNTLDGVVCEIKDPKNSIFKATKGAHLLSQPGQKMIQPLTQKEIDEMTSSDSEDSDSEDSDSEDSDSN